MATKYTVEEAQTRWGVGAPSEERLEELLAVSWQQCIAYAPVDSGLTPQELFLAHLSGAPVVESIPDGHREAHFVQARNIWNATKVAPGSTSYGPDDMPISLHPLDWHVKQLLRPRTGVPKVG